MKWDAKRRRYITESGEKVSSAEIRNYIDEYVESEQEEINSKWDEVLAGSLLLVAFFSWLRDKIIAMHGSAAVLAYGGEENVPWERIGQTVGSELGYVAYFETQLAKAEVTETVWATAGARAQMYAEAAYSTYENSVKEREREVGAIGVRRVTEEDSRVCDGCEAASSEEYVSLDEILDIGDAECMSNCRCWYEFSYLNVEPLEIAREIYA